MSMFKSTIKEYLWDEPMDIPLDMHALQFDDSGFLVHGQKRLLWLPPSHSRQIIRVQFPRVVIGSQTGAITFITWNVPSIFNAETLKHFI